MRSVQLFGTWPGLESAAPAKRCVRPAGRSKGRARGRTRGRARCHAARPARCAVGRFRMRAQPAALRWQRHARQSTVPADPLGRPKRKPLRTSLATRPREGSEGSRHGLRAHEAVQSRCEPQVRNVAVQRRRRGPTARSKPCRCQRQAARCRRRTPRRRLPSSAAPTRV